MEPITTDFILSTALCGVRFATRACPVTRIGNPYTRCETACHPSEHCSRDVSNLKYAPSPFRNLVLCTSSLEFPFLFLHSLFRYHIHTFHRPGSFFELVQRFVGRCCCRQARIRWFQSAAESLIPVGHRKSPLVKA